jgi:hypothetical protein
MLALGGTPVAGFVLAATLMYQGAEGSFSGAPPGAAVTRSAGQVILAVLVDWYPDLKDGWHLGGSLGAVGLAVADAAGNDMSGSAFGGSVLGGYDWWIGPQWSLGLMGVIGASTTAGLQYGDGSSTGYQLTPVTVGIEGSILFH